MNSRCIQHWTHSPGYITPPFPPVSLSRSLQRTHTHTLQQHISQPHKQLLAWVLSFILMNQSCSKSLLSLYSCCCPSHKKFPSQFPGGVGGGEWREGILKVAGWRNVGHCDQPFRGGSLGQRWAAWECGKGELVNGGQMTEESSTLAYRPHSSLYPTFVSSWYVYKT